MAKDISLSRLIEIHDAHRCRHDLGRNLGDGYLLQHNPVFATARKIVLRNGFTFDHKDANDYFAWPLLSLNKILKERRIQYRDNVTVVRRCALNSKGKLTLSDVRRLPPERNAILHESGHCMMYVLAETAAGFATSRNDQRRLLWYLLGESFTIALEFFGNLFCHDELHKFFCRDMNSNVGLEGPVLEDLRELRAKFGSKGSVRFCVSG